MRKLLFALISAFTLSVPAHAVNFITVTVDSTAAPWYWTDGGLNSAYQFGTDGSTAPSVLNLADLGIGAGDSFGLYYIGGTTNMYSPPVVPDGDNAGHVGATIKNNVIGNSGMYLPSAYLPGDWGTEPGSGVFLGALVGTFIEDDGTITSPFSLGTILDGGAKTSSLVGTIPTNSKWVWLGLNDDIFGDNSGQLSVCMDRGDQSCMRTFGAVPEPASWAMLIVGFGVVGSIMRRRGRSAVARTA